ncbi:MAG: hypothetical protein ACLRRT_00545 [Ruthenibacterium lactatiformans]
MTVTAATDVTVLLIPYKSLLRPGVPLDAAHAAVLQNLVAAMADKYFALDRRVELLMLHSLRKRCCTICAPRLCPRRAALCARRTPAPGWRHIWAASAALCAGAFAHAAGRNITNRRARVSASAGRSAPSKRQARAGRQGGKRWNVNIQAV